MWPAFFETVPLIPALVGIGHWAQRFLFGAVCFPKLAPLSAGHLGLVGIVSVAAAAAAVNLVLPLWAPVWLVLAAGLYCFWRGRAELIPVFRRDFPWLLGFTIAHFYFASFDGPSYDMGLYHLPSLVWTRTHGQPLGLANLAPYLGYNSIWFPFEAALSWNGGYLSAFAAGPLLAAFFLTALLRILEIGKSRYSLALALCCCLFWNYLLDGVGQLGANLPAQLYSLYGWFFLVRLAEEREPSAALPALFFALFAAAAKLFALPALGLALIAAGIHFRALRNQRRFWIGFGSLAAVWLTRGLLSSGCFLYPQSLTCVPLPWSSPGLAASLSEEIQRLNGGLLRVFQIGGDWWQALRRGFDIPIARKAGIFLFAVAFTRDLSSARLAAVLLAAQLAGLAFWAAAALQIERFGLHYFVALPAVALGYAVVRLEKGLSKAMVGGAIFVALAGSARTFHLTAAPQERLWPYLPEGKTEERVTASNQIVRVGVVDRSCWEAPPPCTHDFSPGISYRALAWGTFLFYRAP